MFGESCEIAVRIAGTSVMVSSPSWKMGTRALGFRWRSSEGNPALALMTTVLNSMPASRRRMCGAREHAPGEIQSIGSAMVKVRKDGLVERLLVRSGNISI